MKIYIGNLPCGGQIKEDVRRLFSRYGEAWDCVIIKTYGFIHMEEEAGNEAIKHLHGYKLEGKRIRVEKSTSRRIKEQKSKESELGQRLGVLGRTDCENNCNNILAFKRRLAGSNVFRDSGLYGLGNWCTNLGRLSNAVGDHNCNMLGGCNIVNDGRFNRMVGVCNTVGDHSCNKTRGFNAVGGYSPDGFDGTVGDTMYGQGGCACTVNKCNSDWLNAFRNTGSNNGYERLSGIVVKEEKDHGSSDSTNHENGDVGIKMKIAQLNKTIKTEERKPLINERLVNDWRNQVNYLERKIKHLETEKTEFELRSQVKYLQKRVRDLQEEKKVYRDQDLNDHGGRSLPDYQTNQKSLKANKRVKPPMRESSPKRGCLIESQQKQSTTIRHAKTNSKYETENMSDDDIQLIDASDDEDDIKIVDEREEEDVKILSESEEEDVKILSESKLKEDHIFRKRRRDDNVNYISKNEVEILSVNVPKRRNSLTKDGSKNRMQSEKFDEKGDWGVVKSERCYDDIPLICLDDEDDDVKDILEDKDDKQVKFTNESVTTNSRVKDDLEMQNMSDGLGEVFDEGDDNLIQGVPPLQVLDVLAIRHNVRKMSNVFKN